MANEQATAARMAALHGDIEGLKAALAEGAPPRAALEVCTVCTDDVRETALAAISDAAVETDPKLWFGLGRSAMARWSPPRPQELLTAEHQLSALDAILDAGLLPDAAGVFALLQGFGDLDGEPPDLREAMVNRILRRVPLDPSAPARSERSYDVKSKTYVDTTWTLMEAALERLDTDACRHLHSLGLPVPHGVKVKRDWTDSRKKKAWLAQVADVKPATLADFLGDLLPEGLAPGALAAKIVADGGLFGLTVGMTPQELATYGLSFDGDGLEFENDRNAEQARHGFELTVEDGGMVSAVYELVSYDATWVQAVHASVRERLPGAQVTVRSSADGDTSLRVELVAD